MPGMRQWHALGPGSRTAVGSGRMVSRVRALGGNKTLLSVARESAGPHGKLDF
jgi:hypothetical protein